MARTKTVNGKRKPIGTQVSEPVFAAVEVARGDVDRSQWIRGLILEALAARGVVVEAAPEPVKKRAPSRVGDGGLLPPRRREPPPKPDRPLGAGIFQAPGEAAVETPIPPAPAKDRTRCTHPGIRSVGSNMGTCPDCGHRVESGGLWAPECDAGTCGHG